MSSTVDTAVAEGTFQLRALNASVSDRIRYIGSKQRIAGEILAIVGESKRGSRFVDLFCGTGAVSRAAAAEGWQIWANDYLLSASLVTKARLLCCSDVSFAPWGGYTNCVRALNRLAPVEGFIYQEYSPSGCSQSGDRRSYFTLENAGRIDAMRLEIANSLANGLISEVEAHLLVADLMAASNAVANIAGTYGCFLRSWSPTSQRRLRMVPRNLPLVRPDFDVTAVNAFDLRVNEADVVYIDPPYTKRQYAAYYHVLETIAHGDTPYVEGKTGLRPWKDKNSPFCHRRKALQAFRVLTMGICAHRSFVSYSAEGHVALEDLAQAMSEFGSIKVHQLADVARYAPNDKARSKQRHVREYLVELTRC